MWYTFLSDRLAQFLPTSSRPAVGRPASRRHAIESLEGRVVLSGMSVMPHNMPAPAVAAETGPVVTARPVIDGSGQERVDHGLAAANDFGMEQFFCDEEFSGGGLPGGLTPRVFGSGPLDQVGNEASPFDIPVGPGPEIPLAFDPSSAQAPGPMGGPTGPGIPDYPFDEWESAGTHDGWKEFWEGFKDFFGIGCDDQSSNPTPSNGASDEYIKVDPPPTGNPIIDKGWAPAVQDGASQVHGGLNSVTKHLD